MPNIPQIGSTFPHYLDAKYLARMCQRQRAVTLTLPDAGLQLIVEARHPNRWMPTSVPYWEGDVVVRQAETQENVGVGYLEMTGY